jgi:hypothetical protein
MFEVKGETLWIGKEDFPDEQLAHEYVDGPEELGEDDAAEERTERWPVTIHANDICDIIEEELFGPYLWQYPKGLTWEGKQRSGYVSAVFNVFRAWHYEDGDYDYESLCGFLRYVGFEKGLVRQTLLTLKDLLGDCGHNRLSKIAKRVYDAPIEGLAGSWKKLNDSIKYRKQWYAAGKHGTFLDHTESMFHAVVPVTK